jgi:hypothetical protein
MTGTVSKYAKAVTSDLKTRKVKGRTFSGGWITMQDKSLGTMECRIPVR